VLSVFDAPATSGEHEWPYVQKPLYSREGPMLTLVQGASKTLSTPGGYGEWGLCLSGDGEDSGVRRHDPVVGSWYVIDQGACGMGIRESDYADSRTTSAGSFRTSSSRCCRLTPPEVAARVRLVALGIHDPAELPELGVVRLLQDVASFVGSA